MENNVKILQDKLNESSLFYEQEIDKLQKLSKLFISKFN